jgi:hypothetical protein
MRHCAQRSASSRLLPSGWCSRGGGSRLTIEGGGRVPLVNGRWLAFAIRGASPLLWDVLSATLALNKTAARIPATTHTATKPFDTHAMKRASVNLYP